mmetsp:Transcript_90534/g.132413  ORF Transcript_90534/g.132413 Transcript_90534/m.132413 type:complete len:92 (-) Transcript_90534:2125-2400(-)
MAASVRCTSLPRTPVTFESHETVLQSGGSCQENKRILVKIHHKESEIQHLVKKKMGDNVAHGINNLSVKLERKIPQDCNANKICMFERGDH